MKSLLITIALFLSFNCIGQKKPLIETGNLKVSSYTLPASSAFLSGSFRGLYRVLNNRYPEFKQTIPGATDQFWNPEYSWKNKYMDYDNGDMRPKYFGSKTFLIWTTDGRNLSATMQKVFLIGIIPLNPMDKNKSKFFRYVIEPSGYIIIENLGFIVVNDLIFNKK